MCVLIPFVSAYKNTTFSDEWCKNCTQYGNQTFFKFITFTWAPPQYLCSPYPGLNNKFGTIVDFRYVCIVFQF